jgi:uncharacterized protein
MRKDPDPLVSRHIEPIIKQRLSESPVVVLTGIRTVGKSTLLRSCARDHDVPVIDLDDRATLSQVIADPALFVAEAPEPVCVDEFQHDLDLLFAIKSELNTDYRYGRYLLTGSTRYSTLPRAAEALTGRAHVMTIWPLSQGELRGTRETFLDTLMLEPEAFRSAEVSLTSRAEYVEAVLTGGMPIAVAAPTQSARERYFDDLVEMIVLRDVLDIRRVRQRGILQDLTKQLAARTGQVLNISAIATQIGHEARTLSDYVKLLESVFLVHQLPAFARTLGARLAKTPKTHLIDSGIAAHLLGVNQRRLELRQPAALTEFGHVLETFAVNEILKQAAWSETTVRFSHLRSADQKEVDLVAESRDGSVAGIEIKASTTVKEVDFTGLRLMLDRLGDDFKAGVLLNLGNRSYRYDDRLYVVALDRLWAQA